MKNLVCQIPQTSAYWYLLIENTVTNRETEPRWKIVRICAKGIYSPGVRDAVLVKS